MSSAEIHRIIISKYETVDLSHPWSASDVVFLVEQKKIYANKGVLSLSSPIFEAIIFNDYKEKVSESIPLLEKKYNDILLLFTICHTLSHDVPSFIIADVLTSLLPLAVEYQIDLVKKLCNQQLWSRVPFPRTPVEHLIAINMSTSKPVDLSHPWSASDIVFVVEQKKIHANKGVLSLSSPVYDAMLFGDFKEKMSECIQLPGKKYKDVLLLLSICHSLSHDGLSFLTDDSVTFLLPLAREYQVQRVLKLCEQHLSSRPPDIRNILELRCMHYAKESTLDLLKLNV